MEGDDLRAQPSRTPLAMATRAMAVTAAWNARPPAAAGPPPPPLPGGTVMAETTRHCGVAGHSCVASLGSAARLRRREKCIEGGGDDPQSLAIDRDGADGAVDAGRAEEIGFEYRCRDEAPLEALHHPIVDVFAGISDLLVDHGRDPFTGAIGLLPEPRRQPREARELRHAVLDDHEVGQERLRPNQPPVRQSPIMIALQSAPRNDQHFALGLRHDPRQTGLEERQGRSAEV